MDPSLSKEKGVLKDYVFPQPLVQTADQLAIEAI